MRRARNPSKKFKMLRYRNTKTPVKTGVSRILNSSKRVHESLVCFILGIVLVGIGFRLLKRFGFGWVVTSSPMGLSGTLD